jgi:hypothetical protein
LHTEGLTLHKSIIRSMSFSLIISIILVSSGSVFVSKAEGQSASLPTRTLGDKWTLSVNYQSPTGMTGTITKEITSTSTSVSSYDCTEFTLTGGGTTSGQGLTGSWTINGKQYETKTDYTTPKSESTLSAITNTFNETIITSTEYNPSLDNYDFPLSVGKSWASTTTETITSKHDLNGALTQGSDSKKTTSNFTVIRTENTKVAAGEFQTFVIKMTKNDGTSSEIYYSTKAHMQVKELDYFPNGNLAFSLELQSYKVKEPMPTPTATPFAITNPTLTSTPAPTLPDQTPEAPELSWLAILALLLSLLPIALMLRYRKSNKASEGIP